MDPDPGGPKTCRSCGSGSQTLNFYYCISKAKRKQTLGNEKFLLKRSNTQTFFSWCSQSNTKFIFKKRRKFYSPQRRGNPGRIDLTLRYLNKGSFFKKIMQINTNLLKYLDAPSPV
jgi:hypothetical protein